MTSSIRRLSGIVGIAGAAVLSMGSLAMAQTITTNTAQGTVTITESSSTTGTATWNWSGLGLGDYVSVFTFPKPSVESATPLTASDGHVTTSGQYTTSISLPAGDTWSNTGVEMSESAFAVGQLPEVPWAAGLPLLLVIPLGLFFWRRRSRV